MASIDHLRTLLVAPTPAVEAPIVTPVVPEAKAVQSQPTSSTKSPLIDLDLDFNFASKPTTPVSASPVETKENRNSLRENSEMIQGILKRLEIPFTIEVEGGSLIKTTIN